MIGGRSTLFALATGILTAAACMRAAAGPEMPPSGPDLESAGLTELHERTVARLASAPRGAMRAGGLAVVMGGARIRLLEAGEHELLLPIPQADAAQVPLGFAITAQPREAVIRYRVQQREGNSVAGVRLTGGRDLDVRLEWSAMVLIADRPASAGHDDPSAYLRKTPCAQSDDARVRALASRLWPADGRIDRFAANIQAHIGGMKQQAPPRSMDAVGILASGANWICTANANLAVALLRSRGVPARSLAVVPMIGRRLEMHRVVEYREGGRWRRFDPSSVSTEIPMSPWQAVVMARTTIADEERSMKPRMGSSLGCPFGQELELSDGGLALSGDDFFWTVGKPAAEFDAGIEVFDSAKAAWDAFLKNGRLSRSQIEAASADSAQGLLDAFRPK
jgi:hypothetical protein